MLTREQAGKVLKFIRSEGPRTHGGVPRVVPVGSYRRKRSLSKDLDLLVQDFNLPLDTKGSSEIADQRKEEGKAYLKVRSQTGGDKTRQIKGKFYPKKGKSGRRPRPFDVTLDLFKFRPADYPFALLAYSGDGMFVMRMRAHAKRKGYLLDQYGLYRRINGKKGSRVSIPKKGDKLSERDIFRFLKYKYKKPEDRDTSD